MKVTISIDEQLLSRTDDYANRNFVSRSGVISAALDQYLAQKQAADAMQSIAASFKSMAEKGMITQEDQNRMDSFLEFAKMYSK